MASGSENLSSSSFVVRAEPYPNTRNSSKGNVPLNNKNPELSGYKSATSKRVAHQQKKQKTFSSSKETLVKEVLVDNTSSMDVDNETTGTVHTPDPLETLLANAAKPDSVVKELEERQRREQEKLEMQAAVKASRTRQAPELTSDAKTPGQVTSNVTSKGKDKSVSTTIQNAQAGPSTAETFTPVSVSPPQPRINIARSQRFSLFAPVTDFTMDDLAAIKKSLFNLYASST